MKEKFRAKWRAPLALLLGLALALSLVTAVPVAASPADWYVTEGGAGNKDGTSWDNAFDSIQAAVNAASGGDTIMVAAGTYNENVVVWKAVTIKSAVKHGAVVVGQAVGVCASWAWDVFRVIADGATVEGFDVRMYTPSPWDSQSRDGIAVKASGVTVKDNRVTQPGTLPFTGWVQGTGWAISVIPDDASPGGTCGATVANPNEELSGVTIEGNEISGIRSGGIWVTGTDCLIKNNKVEHTQYTGILLAPYGSKYGHKNTITGNELTNCGTQWNYDDGIRFGGNAQGNTATYNTITGSSRDGIRNVASASGNVAHYNSISGNTGYGVNNQNTDAMFDASANWWGDASGPTHPMNALGTGDAVSDNVAFVPWLDDTYDVGNPVYLVYIGEEGYESIQEAVDAAEPGDTITVGPGIYVGDIVISQNVTLVAPAGAKLEGTGLGPVVTIEDYTVTIEGFEIDPGTDGIYIKLISAGEVVTIQNVDIYRNTGHGINVGEVFGTLEVFNSNIYENKEGGINIDLVGEGGIVVINFNTIVGNDEFNSYYGLYVNNWGEGVIIDARYNWWGDVSGPEDPAAYEVTGYQAYGDKVSANVDFEPWLLEEVDPEVTPTTYDKTLALKDGWTLVSSNKEVATGTVWIGTTPLVDEELEEEATILAYKYTAGTGYTQVTLATQLTSVDAYYVKTIGGGGVGIIYSDAAPGVVTKNLGEGWNIISAASETMNAYTLLVQLRGTEIEVGITTLVVQGGYNQFMVSSFWPLVTDAEWEALVDEKLMLSPFGGFWVHMNTAKTFGVIPD